jgi:hypothetical protein
MRRPANPAYSLAALLQLISVLQDLYETDFPSDGQFRSSSARGSVTTSPEQIAPSRSAA